MLIKYVYYVIPSYYQKMAKTMNFRDHPQPTLKGVHNGSKNPIFFNIPYPLTQTVQPRHTKPDTMIYRTD